MAMKLTTTIRIIAQSKAEVLNILAEIQGRIKEDITEKRIKFNNSNRWYEHREMKIGWSNRDIELLKAHFDLPKRSRVGIDEFCKILGRKKSAVYTKARQLGYQSFKRK